MNDRKKIKIGFDLDGVIIDKPPFMPKSLLEFLYGGKRKKTLEYRFPHSYFEQKLRWLSHGSLLRPPIYKNLDAIKKLAKNNHYKLFVISSRYSFLKLRTDHWMKTHRINKLFEDIYLNLKNEQPHAFKERMIKKLKLDLFIDDDDLIVEYLKLRCHKTKVVSIKEKNTFIHSLTKPNILISISYYYPNISGLSIYAKRLAEGLVEKGHKVTVITSKNKSTLPRRELINGVEVIRSKVLFKIGKGVIMPLLPLEAFLLINKYQVVNCHLPQFESSLFALIGKFYGKKVILTHHTDLSSWEGTKNRISESAVWLSQIVAGFFADYIVPYTKDYAAHSWYLKLFKTKVKAILPPIKVNTIDKGLREKWIKKLEKKQIIIGFSGRIARQKGIPHLLKAIAYIKKEIPSFKIVFAGPYNNVIGENYLEVLKPLIESNKNYLRFFGSINPEKISTFYSLCDVLVLPSDDTLESFGLVQVEAMLVGCPVVATNLPGARIPIKKTGMGILVEPRDPKSLAKAIVKVIKNKKKYKQPVNIIEKKFNFHQTITEYQELFKTI